MKALAPGKLILSGEHSVLYGQPALAMAVNRFVTVTINPQSSKNCTLHFPNLNYHENVSVELIAALKPKIKFKYQEFLQGKRGISEVLQNPFELAQVALALFFDNLNIKHLAGLHIHLLSTIPRGCGMGSSAATILSMMYAIASYLQINLSNESFLTLGLEAENFQHGRSSGLDLHVSMNGGCVYVKDMVVEKRKLPTEHFYFVNTGSPDNTTGKCVEIAAKVFQKSGIQYDFGAVTIALDKALIENKTSTINECLRQNHYLLNKLHVVPAYVQKFIQQIELLGGAAKICGAGAVTGTHAGMVLVMISDILLLQQLCDQYNFELMALEGVTHGIQHV
jgi:mevalonate kinase